MSHPIRRRFSLEFAAMRLFGLLLVKNEADIIEELLSFLREIDVYDRIFFFDLGSDDDTFQKALQFAALLHNPQVLDRPYSERLRMEMLVDHAHLYRAGDWVAVIDADEFYVDDPWALIAEAEREPGADSIHTFQAQFYLTDGDVAAASVEDPREPIRQRRRHYLVNWSEPRFFKYRPGQTRSLTWDRPCSRRLLNRHYQFRTPNQIQTRVRTRMDNLHHRLSERRPDYSPWMHLHSTDWNDYVVPHELLHYDDGGPLRWGLPDGVTNDAYRLPPFNVKTPELAGEFRRERMNNPVRPLAAREREELRRSPPLARPTLLELGVTVTRAGEPFNVQPDGTAAIWVRHQDAESGTVIAFDGRPLRTVSAAGDVLTATVPSELFAAPGRKPICLMVGGLCSNVLMFEVH